jgi:hypothetical protein
MRHPLDLLRVPAFLSVGVLTAGRIVVSGFGNCGSGYRAMAPARFVERAWDALELWNEYA